MLSQTQTQISERKWEKNFVIPFQKKDVNLNTSKNGGTAIATSTWLN